MKGFLLYGKDIELEKVSSLSKIFLVK